MNQLGMYFIMNTRIFFFNISKNLYLLTQIEFILKAEEISFAQTIINKDSRVSFLISRCLLRLLLSSELDVRPIEINLSFSRFGKPFIVFDTSLKKRIFFSVSHTANLLGIAISKYSEIGFDIETIKSSDSIRTIYRKYNNRKNIQKSFFYSIFDVYFYLKWWTAIEAKIKISGESSFSKQFFSEINNNQNTVSGKFQDAFFTLAWTDNDVKSIKN